MSREIQWKCQYEDALIQPPRGVLDIHMGNYAAGDVYKRQIHRRAPFPFRDV